MELVLAMAATAALGWWLGRRWRRRRDVPEESAGLLVGGVPMLSRGDEEVQSDLEEGALDPDELEDDPLACDEGADDELGLICPEWRIAYASRASYRMYVVRRTSLNLDLDLVAEARTILGSNGTTDTVHRALEDVVRREKLRWLAERDFSELTPEVLGDLRATRTW
jgi:Arc/MetJ family transcription regulator